MFWSMDVGGGGGGGSGGEGEDGRLETEEDQFMQKKMKYTNITSNCKVVFYKLMNDTQRKNLQDAWHRLA